MSDLVVYTMTVIYDSFLLSQPIFIETMSKHTWTISPTSFLINGPKLHIITDGTTGSVLLKVL